MSSEFIKSIKTSVILNQKVHDTFESCFRIIFVNFVFTSIKKFDDLRTKKLIGLIK